jgi:hypothetical protein
VKAIAHSLAPSPTVSPIGSDPHSTLLPTGTRHGSAVEIAVTPRIRAALVTSGAAMQELPRKDYSGVSVDLLAKDTSTGDRWAVGKLSVTNTSVRAAVAQQDNGGYQAWVDRPGSGWQASDVGGFGPPSSGQHPCPVPIPTAVRTLWKLRKDTCMSRLQK